MQKIYIILFLGMLFNFSCNTPNANFPERKDVLIPEVSDSENFFPIARLDLSKKGIKEKLPILFVFFDPANKTPFPAMSDVDHVSFKLESDGKCSPLFSKEVLHISDNYKQYLNESIEKYNQLKKANTQTGIFIDMESPEWWQEDETPLNAKGESCIFVCQVDMYDIVTDDCRMYVFYDPYEKLIKYIYQRT